MPFAGFFGAGVRVENRAVNGHSTQRFIDEGRWDLVRESLRPNDWVLIQFGHNDESPRRKTATTAEQFAANLVRFVGDVRDRSAEPVLLTPITRRRFGPDGKVLSGHPYSTHVRTVADQLSVPMIDMDVRSSELLDSLGPERAQMLYLHIGPHEHPNYPDGIADDTHLNELGARLMAQLVLAGLRDSGVHIAWTATSFEQPDASRA